ncbi:unnamed protein product [Pylaiella littoralis]
MDARALELAKEATDRACKMAALQASDDFQDDSAPLTEQEQAEAEAVRKKAISQIGSAIRMVRAQLAAVDSKDASKRKQKRDEPMQCMRSIPVPDRVPGLGGVSGTNEADEIPVPVSPEELDGVTQSIDDMLNSASNVVNDFDEVLEKPFLEQFSATLDRVPLIGIQDRKVMYSRNILIDDNASTVFEEFDGLPDDAPEDISSAKVFPLNGNVYLCIGTSVWRKDHLNGSNDVLADSVDNWPLTYQAGWFKIGDDVFPADIVDASFFGQLSDPQDPTSTPITRILLLDSSGQLYTFGGTLQSSGNTFVPIAFKPSDDVKEAPVWEKIAFTRGNLHAYANGVIWALALSLSEATRTYTVDDKTTVGDVLEMEGNETGLVLRRDDGFLYQQYIQVSDPKSAPIGDFPYKHPEAASGDPTLVELSYSRWIEAPSDLRMIGVASPGVELNLRILTSSLKGRYLRTQTVLYPVVEKIRTFTLVHNAYLDYLQTEADKYSATNPPTDEEAIAQANTYVAHVSYWTEVINDAVTGVKGTVNVMAADAQTVKLQLRVQLSMIEEDLLKLEAALNGLEDAKSDLKKQLITGIALLVGGVLSFLALSFFAMPVAGLVGGILGGGLLFVAGVIMTVSASQGLAEVNELVCFTANLQLSHPRRTWSCMSRRPTQQAIADTESKIRVLTTTHGQLSQISELYDGIDGAHEALNIFWGRMFNDARQLQSIVDVFNVFGAQLLLGSMSFNITAAKTSVDSLSGGCTAYLDLLNSQGVQVGSFATARALDQEWSAEDAFDPKASKPGPISEAELDSDRDSFARAATYSVKLLQAKDVNSYLKHLKQEIVPRGKITTAVLKGEIVRARV